MNFYKKINQYFLERMPTMWNTHFVWMLLICLCTHLLYYVMGYTLLDFEVLKEYGVKYLFFKGASFSFYFIIGILALIYFGFRYFTHNPFKHFYPISSSYFWKIFAQLFLLFFLYGTVFISFENGLKRKAKKLVPITIVESEAYKIEKAKPFFYNQISDYFIKSRSFPKPFPCDEVQNFTIGYDSSNSVEIKHQIDFKKPYVTLSGYTYQFGKITLTNIDSCNTKENLDTIYDVSKIYGLASYSLYNYNSIHFYNTRKYIDDNNFVDSEIDIETIHKLQQTKDSNAIANSIQDVINICKKYSINEQLSPMKMASAGLKQNLNEQQLIRTGFKDYKKYNKDENDSENVQVDYEATTAVDDKEIANTPTQIDFNYFVDLPKFDILKDNVRLLEKEMGTKQINTDMLWVIIFTSLAFALLFVLIKYIALRDVIIGIFVSAILFSILALFITASYKNGNESEEIRVIKFGVIYAAIILIIGFCAIFGKAIKKQFVTKGFVAFCIATLAFFPSLLFYIRQKSFIEIKQLCDTYPKKVYAFDFEPWQFVALILLSIFIIFAMLRKVYSKVE